MCNLNLNLLHQDLAKLLKIFSKNYYEEVHCVVVLIDQAENQFHVTIKNFFNKMYFGKDWKEVGGYYELWFGGWMRLMYVDVGDFTWVLLIYTLGLAVLYHNVVTVVVSLGDHVNPINIF